MINDRYWESRPLHELNRYEWEALCDGCAQCCVRRKRSGEAVESLSMASFCYLLDAEPCRCSSYADRKQLEPNCIILSADRPELFKLMPRTCAYRLISEGKPLPDWHPLMSQDPDSARPYKAFVNGKLNMRPSVPESPLPPAQPDPSGTIIPMTGLIPAHPLEANAQTSQPPARAAEPKPGDSTFVTMSHKVRTELNTIIGAAQQLSDTALPRDLRNHINTILKASSDVSESVNHIFDITALEYGQLALYETPLNLNALCEQVDRLIRPYAAQKQLQFRCVCRDNVPSSVLCDKRRLMHVLEQLLRAAVDRTCSGSVGLDISCQKKGARGTLILFRMVDTGAVLHERQQAMLQSDPGPVEDNDTLKKLRHNLGLELVVCRKIIETMNGDIELVSNKKTGNMVNIALPLYLADNPETIRVDTRTTVSRPNTRVLLAEDNRLNRHVVMSALKAAGCDVVAVDNGSDAVGEVHKNKFDVILMDCRMPGMDGFEATRRIRAMDPPANSVPIIALTALALKGDREKCLTKGMSDYLPKPVDRQKLIETINRHVAV